jgi:hypothetical protein
MWKHIRSDPLLSAMYKDELLARDLEEERRGRKINKRTRVLPR